MTPPRVIRVDLEASCGLEVTEAEPVLVIGAPLIWELSRDALAVQIAQPLALLPDLSPGAMRAFRLRRRLAESEFWSLRTPLVGSPVNRTAFGLERRLNVLVAHAHEAGRRRVDAAGFRMNEHDAEQMKVMNEAWDLLVQRWVLPALDLGMSPHSLGRGFTEMLVDLRISQLVSVTQEGEPTLSPTGNGRLLDERVSLEVADRAFTPIQRWVDWDDYIDVVTTRRDRLEAGELFAVADVVTGRTQAANIDTVINLFEGPHRHKVIELLEPAAVGDKDYVLAVLKGYAEATVRTFLVDAGVAVRELNWGAICLLHEPDGGEDIPTYAAVTALVERHDGKPLRRLINDLGQDPETPLLISAAEERPDHVLTLVAARQGWTHVIAATTRESLLLLKSPRRLGFWRERAGRNTALEQFNDLPGQPVAAVEQNFTVLDRIRFAELRTAEVKATRWRISWRATLRTTDREVQLAGRGSGLALAQLIDARIGDRLLVRGPIDIDVRRRASRGFVPIALLLIGFVLLGFAGWKGLEATKTAYDARVLSCEAATGDETGYTCRIRVQPPSDEGVAYVDLSQRPETGSTISVAVDDSGAGHVEQVDPDALRAALIYGVFGVLMLVFALTSAVERDTRLRMPPRQSWALGR